MEGGLGVEGLWKRRRVWVSGWLYRTGKNEEDAFKKAKSSLLSGPSSEGRDSQQRVRPRLGRGRAGRPGRVLPGVGLCEGRLEVDDPFVQLDGRGEHEQLALDVGEGLGWADLTDSAADAGGAGRFVVTLR